jgi:alpha-1,6-mannosyltransferase
VKIVDVTEFYSERGGGVRSHLTTRGHVLCQLGHDHAVIAPGPRDEESVLAEPGLDGDPPLAKSARARVVRVAGPALPYDRTYHLLGRFGKIRSRVRAERPDVLEAHSPYLATAAILACGPRAAPVRTAFWHADHVGTYVQPALAKRLGEAAAGALTAPLWRGVRALLAPFDATFVAGVAQERRLRAAGVPNVVRAPFGVDTRTFAPSARSSERRLELLAGAKGPLLVGVGRFAFEKRWDVVMAAFARVHARHGGALVLFGDGPERERLGALAPPGVRFAGFETDRRRLAGALSSADVLVHGCPYETFGIGVAEAVACGLPVVVPDAGGAAESVDRSCGETYRSLDAEACAQSIERLLARAPDELRERALVAASRVVTLDEHFGRVLAVYGDLLRESRRGASEQRAS